MVENTEENVINQLHATGLLNDEMCLNKRKTRELGFATKTTAETSSEMYSSF